MGLVGGCWCGPSGCACVYRRLVRSIRMVLMSCGGHGGRWGNPEGGGGGSKREGEEGSFPYLCPACNLETLATWLNKVR